MLHRVLSYLSMSHFFISMQKSPILKLVHVLDGLSGLKLLISDHVNCVAPEM